MMLSHLPMFVGTLTLDGVVTDYNFTAIEGGPPARDEIIGRRLRDCHWWTDSVETQELTDRMVEQAASGEPADAERAYRRYNGGTGIVELRLAPIFDEAGKPVEILGMGMDVTERARDKEHLHVLLGELNHRVKNMLTLVQSLVTMSLRNANDIETARATIRDRLAAYARSHDFMFRGKYHNVPLSDLIESALSSFSRDQFVVEHCDALLPAKRAVTLALALHELATNAVKYGALSVPSGQVALKSVCDDVDGRTHLRLSWTETGGPKVTPPEKRGFGSLLIERAVKAEFDGDISLEFAPDGVRWTLEAVFGG